MLPLLVQSTPTHAMRTLQSRAKINLGLRILGKRDDGYHNIESVFLYVNLCDTLHIERAERLEVVCQPHVTDSAEDNIVYKAAVALEKALRMTGQTTLFPTKITVSKSIPTGAGLGGGSSNAATTLLALSKMWLQTNTLPSEVNEVVNDVALQLGSDVPFFLQSKPAFVCSRGEVLQPLNDTPNVWILLVMPGIHINTAWAYQQIEPKAERNDSLLDEYDALCSGQTPKWTAFSNDFCAPVYAAHPILHRIEQQLEASGAMFASMSGSGSTMYGLFDRREAAEEASTTFENFTTYICGLSDKKSP